MVIIQDREMQEAKPKCSRRCHQRNFLLEMSGQGREGQRERERERCNAIHSLNNEINDKGSQLPILLNITQHELISVSIWMENKKWK
jgi:hypothetical protein